MRRNIRAQLGTTLTLVPAIFIILFILIINLLFTIGIAQGNFIGERVSDLFGKETQIVREDVFIQRAFVSFLHNPGGTREFVVDLIKGEPNTHAVDFERFQRLSMVFLREQFGEPLDSNYESVSIRMYGLDDIPSENKYQDYWASLTATSVSRSSCRFSATSFFVDIYVSENKQITLCVEYNE